MDKFQIFEKVSDILYKHDVFDLKLDGASKEEYENETKEIIKIVKKKDCFNEVKRKVSEVFQLEIKKMIFSEEPVEDEFLEDMEDNDFIHLLSEDIYKIYNEEEVDFSDYDIVELKCIYNQEFLKEILQDLSMEESNFDFEEHVTIEWLSLKESQFLIEDLLDKHHLEDPEDLEDLF